ncbi:hypothetical protein MSP7336_02185 [Mycobacterium shimoidei]|uniref:DUF732 domain-containing protein n=2 Tax=Mycobacterium shimoidei TaxID=29313 RepID=A0A375YYH2_MYCSH|nr:hypothetical protein MSP7336_02185 [Mycobacterium shimoidei]
MLQGMKRLLLLMSMAAMVGLAAPAHADGNDAGFLAALDQQGISHSAGAGQTVLAGQAVCELMDRGLSPVDTVNAVRSTNPAMTVEQSARFAVTAASAFCPQHL